MTYECISTYPGQGTAHLVVAFHFINFSPHFPFALEILEVHVGSIVDGAVNAQMLPRKTVTRLFLNAVITEDQRKALTSLLPQPVTINCRIVGRFGRLRLEKGFTFQGVKVNP